MKGNKEKRDVAAGLDASNEMKLKSELARSRESPLCNRRPSSDFCTSTGTLRAVLARSTRYSYMAFTATVHSLL